MSDADRIKDLERLLKEHKAVVRRLERKLSIRHDRQAGAAQRITAYGAELRFYCLCTPRFVPASYVNLEASGSGGRP